MTEPVPDLVARIGVGVELLNLQCQRNFSQGRSLMADNPQGGDQRRNPPTKVEVGIRREVQGDENRQLLRNLEILLPRTKLHSGRRQKGLRTLEIQTVTAVG